MALVGLIAVHDFHDRMFKRHNDHAVVSVRKMLINNFSLLRCSGVVEMHCASVMNNLESGLISKIFKYSRQKVFP